MGKTESIIRHFPDFYKSEDPGTVFYRFTRVFGEILDQAEEDLIRVMRSHWADTADNADSRGFNTTHKGDLDRIFTLYLENLGGTSQLKQGKRDPALDDPDAVYRERIKGLIHVLKNGASTKQGITAIIAANLGIVAGKEGYEKALEQIRIEEYSPRIHSTGIYTLAVNESFTVENPNAVEVTPGIRIRFRDDLPFPLANPGIENTATGESVSYAGTVAKEDVLLFFPDGTVLLNGAPAGTPGAVMLPGPGKSNWCFTAQPGLNAGRFDRTPFDYSLFELSQLNRIGVFDAEEGGFDKVVFAFPAPVAEVTFTFSRLTPASFMVRIPWDLPGFTESFDKLAEDPRQQIKYIVNKVKAAGVMAVVAYEKKFTEDQELGASYAVKLGRKEEHNTGDGNFFLGSRHAPYPGGIEHRMTDKLTISGMFDYTGFDTLNTFA